MMIRAAVSAYVALALATPAIAGPRGPAAVTAARSGLATAASAFSQAEVDAAIDRFRAGDFEGALTAFRELVARAPAGQRLGLRWNIARCLEELDRVPEALAAFEQYRSEADTDARRKRAEAKIEGIETTRLGRVAVQCPTPEMQVQLGALTRPCPTIFERVTPGPVILIARSGAAEARTMHAVTAGQTLTVELAPPSEGAPAPAPPPAAAAEAGDDDGDWWPWAVAGGVVITGAVVLGAVLLSDGGEAPAPVYTFEFE